jgi:uncharacterized protein YcbX
VDAIFRYPVKSMAGEPLQLADVGWHGIEGDRRLAFRRTEEDGGFPWLTASSLPDLVRFTPVRREAETPLATHVRTPDSQELTIFGTDLRAEIERRHGARLEMTHLRGGIFDDASISVMAVETIEEIGKSTQTVPDARRFRPNVVLRLERAKPFQEDGWIGGVLAFGEPGEGPRISVVAHDVRCSIVNIHPDSARCDPGVLRFIVRANKNNAGVYGTVIRTGRLAIGQRVHLYEHP